MATDFTITQNLETGETALFVDTSTDVTFADVKAVRLVIGYYPLAANPQTLTAGNEMEQWREYQNIKLPAPTYDNKVIPVTGLFVPFISGIPVASGNEMKTTGNYSPFIDPADWLPTVNYTPLVRTPADFGVEPVSDKFPDAVYSGSYEQYGDNSPGTPTNLVDGKKYIVFGTGATCTFDGNIYREGEVFQAQSSNAVSFTGGGTVKILTGIRFKYFPFTYFIQSKLANIQAYIQANCICNETIQYQLSDVYRKLLSVQDGILMNLMSPRIAQDMINDMNSELDGVYTTLGI